MKDVKVFLSKDAKEVYTYLNANSSKSKTERMILKALNQKIELLKINPHFGNPIAKKLIPEEYREKYDIKTLFRIELPNYWRMLYTLTEGATKIEIVCFIIDIIDHPEYNKKFGYRKK